jgi:predicted GNAT superfamily acetyltransferase
VSIVIRDAMPADVAVVLRINNAAVPAMNVLDDKGVRWLLAHAAYARVAVAGEQVAGFLIGLPPGAGYDSDNYRWFSERYDDFLYIDRIAIDERARSGGIGSGLYDDIAAFARARWPRIVAEVNLDPPNPRSEAFHARHGFVRVGELARDRVKPSYAYRMVMLARELSPG